MKAKPPYAGALVFGALLLSAPFLRGASPFLAGIDPPGGQTGTQVETVISGDRLGDAKGILFYSPGIDVVNFQVVDDKKIKATLKIAPDCPTGEHPFRVWTATGITIMELFTTGPFPTVNEKEPNNDAAHAQAVPLNVTVSGVIKGEETDCYAVQVKKGQRLVAAVEGMRLGITMFDPSLAILSKDGRVLAQCDDSTLLLQDPLAYIVAPEDGTYLVEIRDSAYEGTDKSKYRLHIGTFPQPTVIFPPGGPAGRELALRFLGDPLGPMESKRKLPPLEDRRSKTETLFASQGGVTAPEGNPVRVSPFENVMELEPNNDASTATKTTLSFPLAFNGIISEKGDVDFFRFKAAKDQSLDFRVYARALRSPLDSVLRIYDGKGKQLATNDDAGGPDSYLRFKIPTDGEYCLSVTDHIKRGGPDFVYRVEVTPVEPEVSLTMTQPVVNTQERQTVEVPRGNRFGAVLRVKRTDFDGGINVASSDLPPGMTMEIAPMPPNSDTVPVVFEVTADAQVAGKVCKLSVTPSDSAKKVNAGFEHAVDLVISNPNNTVYYQARVDKLAAAVTEEAPFKLTIVQPKVPLVQNGSMALKVQVERKENFHGPIEIAMLYKPNGIGADNTVKIPEDKNEGVISISANDNAPVRKWKLAATGSANPGKGQVWVCSPFTEVEVAPPFLTGKLDLGKAEPGKTATLTCKLVQNKPFEGKAKIQLLNLPNKVSSQEMEITAADQEVQFPLNVDKSAAAGIKKDLFCAVTIMQDGEPIVQNIAQGGVLRVVKAADKK